MLSSFLILGVYRKYFSCSGFGEDGGGGGDGKNLLFPEKPSPPPGKKGGGGSSGGGKGRCVLGGPGGGDGPKNLSKLLGESVGGLGSFVSLNIFLYLSSNYKYLGFGAISRADFMPSCVILDLLIYCKRLPIIGFCVSN